VDEARAREPIARLRARLLEEGVAAGELDGIEGNARSEMARAREAALAAPWPDPATAWQDVQDAGAVQGAH